MLNYDWLKKIVRQGEGQTVEFKLKSNHPERIVREAVAFANSIGGYLIFGVSDQLEIKGLKFVEEDEYIISKHIQEQIQPIPEYQIHKIGIENEKSVLIYEVFEGKEKPYKLLLEHLESKIYLRTGDKSIQASKEVKEILKGRKKNRSYRFQYGQKEKLLVKFLDENKKITLKTFAEIANIPLKIASKTLVLLVLSGVLDVRPSDIEDCFILKSELN